MVNNIYAKIHVEDARSRKLMPSILPIFQFYGGIIAERIMG